MVDPIDATPTHRWYARPVFFVTDLARSVRFYQDSLGFKKDWPEDISIGPVAQVSRSDCEIILCQNPARTDRTRLFVELTVEGLDTFRHELSARGGPHKATWWGYDTTQVNDPDGNELFFPVPG
jgi:catechol 2,3-dioxygenase-like lactoylglutathione lyase family enzyme